MVAASSHRGPDGQGVEEIAPLSLQAPPAILGHTRLAVLDPTPLGRQPMTLPPSEEDSRHWITYNGEIFNFFEIRKQLSQIGSACSTLCDTEVILRAYRAWGEGCVERMRGMFAWCLLDVERGTAWLCRDRLGIKPLYVAPPRSGGLLFASEVRTLLAAGPDLVPARANPAALESFLAQGAVWGNSSIIEGVTMLGAGESLICDWSGRPLSHRRYWMLPDPRRDVPAPDRDEAVDRIAALQREAIQLALVSDVPTGLFLSGGVNSAALATLAAEVTGSTVETINLGFEEPEFDESAEAAEIARALGTRHHQVRLTGREVLDSLPHYLGSVNQPTSDGLNSFLISRAARHAGLKVALSGLGGDELFGGYRGHRAAIWAACLRKWLRWADPLRPALGQTARILGGRRGDKVVEMFARDRSLVSIYLLRREQSCPASAQLHPLPEGCEPVSGLPLDFFERLREAEDATDPINLLSWLDLTAYTRETLMRDADVFSMAHGLEVRVPFLDHRLVELISPLPGSWKRPIPGPSRS